VAYYSILVDEWPELKKKLQSVKNERCFHPNC
jgi:hypothetical protein